MKKCEKCGAPLEGFMSKISSFFGAKPSKKNKNRCVKCEDKE